MNIYHGTNAEFRKFDLSRYGSTNGTSLGIGIYWTADKERAMAHGDHLHQRTVNLKHFTELSESQITRQGMRRFMALTKIADWSNYCGISVSDVAAGCDSDIDLYSDLLNSGAVSPDQIQSIYQDCYIRSADRPDEYVFFQ